jgi:hypothetical protein
MNTWDGAARTLTTNEQVVMPQTPNGSVILAWRNMAMQNNDGTLALATEGSPPQMLDAPALNTAPSILASNWKGGDLRLTNISINAPIWIEMLGPGLPGMEPIPLPLDTRTTLAPLHTAQGRGLGFMRLLLESNTNDWTTIAVIGGPMDSSGNNAYLFALNYPGATLPGYTAVTTGNSYSFEFNWSNSAVFVVNLSGEYSSPLQLLLQSLNA